MKKISPPLLVVVALTTIAGLTGIFQRPGGNTRDKAQQTASIMSGPGKPASCCIAGNNADETDGNSIYQLKSEWTDQEGKHARLSDFCSGPTVIAMFYSHCAYACPLTINDMKKVQAALPDDLKGHVRFVLVTFDPARDTPAVLHSLAEQRGLTDGSWELLTGKTTDVRTLAEMLGVEFKMQADGSFAHSSQIEVLNGAGVILYKHRGVNEPIGDLVLAIKSALGNSPSFRGDQINKPGYK